MAGGGFAVISYDIVPVVLPVVLLVALLVALPVVVPVVLLVVVPVVVVLCKKRRPHAVGGWCRCCS